MMNPSEPTSLFSNYSVGKVYFDEMFRPDGTPRNACRMLYEALNEFSIEEMQTMQEHAERFFLHEGITFAVYGDDGAQERIIPIDLLPRILTPNDWRILDRGLTQRLSALNQFLGDIYGAKKILLDGIIPTDLVLGCPQYRPEMRNIQHPHGSFVSICGTDIVRTFDGFMVLEDNLRVPSGVSYMLANRQAVKSSIRDLFRRHRVRKIEHYGQALRQTLVEMSPNNSADPCIALLTPGTYNSAFYEHLFLAREMGIELVQGEDLSVRRGKVFMRTTRGQRQVDVIYRRVDDDFIDPLVFRKDSLLGVPGLFSAYALGNVTLVNAPGTGVADDKSVYAYVPEMIRYYLAEEPILANVQTYLCRYPEQLEFVLDNLDKLVVKTVGGSGGYGMLVGPHATVAERAAYADVLRENPANYSAQPTLDLSCSPCITASGVAPRHVDLRTFVLRAEDTRIVPGAFSRVALREGSLVVNSSQGGGGKDLWVLSK